MYLLEGLHTSSKIEKGVTTVPSSDSPDTSEGVLAL